MNENGPKGFSAGRFKRDLRESEYRPDIRIFRARNGFAVMSYDQEGQQFVEIASKPEDVARLVAKRLTKEA